MHHQLMEEEDNNQPPSKCYLRQCSRARTNAGSNSNLSGPQTCATFLSPAAPTAENKDSPPNEPSIGSRGDDKVSPPTNQPASQEAHLHHSTLNSPKPPIKKTSSLPQSRVTPTHRWQPRDEVATLRELAAHGSQLWPP